MEELVTKEDLRRFRLNLISDIREIVLELLNEKEDDSSSNNEWLRSKEVRKILNISPGTLQNLRIAGKISFRKVLGSYYYRSRDLDNLFEEGK